MKNKIKILISKNKGNVIFEAVIILPIVFIVIFALFLLGFRLHEQTTLDGAAKRGVIYASKIIADPQYRTVTSASSVDGKDIVDLNSENGDFTKMDDIQPYRYFSWNIDDEKNAVENYVSDVIKKSNIGWDDIENVKITYDQKNYVIYQEVSLKITASYELPAIFGNFGLPTHYDIESRAVMAVNDPDEFIRNADLARDIVDNVLVATGADKKIDSVKEKVSSVFGKIIEYKNKLFK